MNTSQDKPGISRNGNKSPQSIGWHQGDMWEKNSSLQQVSVLMEAFVVFCISEKQQKQ